MSLLAAFALALFSAAAAPSAEDAQFARITTSMGAIDVRLFRDEAPVTTANFLSYATRGHYDRTIFHRVVHGTLIQGGGYNARLYERPTDDPIINEATNGLSNKRGTLAMARFDDPDSARAQFFINLADNTFLDRTGDEWKRDAGYAVFGEVVAGMDVADAIGAVATGEGEGGIYLPAEVPLDPIIILRIDPIGEDSVGATP